jgi:hypothetical protein
MEWQAKAEAAAAQAAAATAASSAAPEPQPDAPTAASPSPVEDEEEETRQAREHASTSIIDNITGPEVGFKQDHAVQLDRPNVKTGNRRKPTRMYGKTFEELNKAEDERLRVQSQTEIRADMVNQSFDDPLGILEEYTKAKEQQNVAQDALDSFAAFKKKAAERREAQEKKAALEKATAEEDARKRDAASTAKQNLPLSKASSKSVAAKPSRGSLGKAGVEITLDEDGEDGAAKPAGVACCVIC